MKILLISTTTNEKKSSSRALLSLVERACRDAGHEVEYIDANKLHIVKNLSCYADGGEGCASYEAGPYRCWAHKLSLEDPEKYGGEDEMPAIYDGISWADAVVFATSVRWGNHSALLQTIIERMNTLENRHAVYGEPNPLRGKKAGVVVTGQHWKSQDVTSHLLEVLSLFGFDASPDSALTWQATNDMHLELETNNAPAAKADMVEQKFAPVYSLLASMGV